MNILVTGSNSGLGKYLCEKFHAVGLVRGKPLKITKTFDVIIHCAFNRTDDDLYQYLKDNIYLTENLAWISHKKFIYISSTAVYDADDRYGITKLYAESIVKNICSDWLILRTGALLGKYSRKNNLIKLITENKPKLTLTKDSEFNCLLHSDVGDFIKVAIEKDLRGIYNFVSRDTITLDDIAIMLNKKDIQYGSYCYKCGRQSNEKIAPFYNKSSKEVVFEFMEEIK